MKMRNNYLESKLKRRENEALDMSSQYELFCSGQESSENVISTLKKYEKSSEKRQRYFKSMIRSKREHIDGLESMIKKEKGLLREMAQSNLPSSQENSLVYLNGLDDEYSHIIDIYSRISEISFSSDDTDSAIEYQLKIDGLDKESQILSRIGSEKKDSIQYMRDRIIERILEKYPSIQDKDYNPKNDQEKNAKRLLNIQGGKK